MQSLFRAAPGPIASSPCALDTRPGPLPGSYVRNHIAAIPSCTSTGSQGSPQSKFYGRSVCAKLLAAWALLLVDFAAVAGDEASVLRGPAPLGGVFQATPMSVDSINELKSLK